MDKVFATEIWWFSDVKEIIQNIWIARNAFCALVSYKVVLLSHLSEQQIYPSITFPKVVLKCSR